MQTPSQRRAEHRGTPARCLAEGRLVGPGQITVRSMNFGQRWRTPGIEDFPVEVELPASFVEPRLQAWLDEMRADAERHPDDDLPGTLLPRRGWPAAPAASRDPALAAMLARYCGFDLLLEWLGDGEPDELPGWVMNSVDGWRRSGEVVRLEGTARRAGQAVRYQD